MPTTPRAWYEYVFHVATGPAMGNATGTSIASTCFFPRKAAPTQSRSGVAFWIGAEEGTNELLWPLGGSYRHNAAKRAPRCQLEKPINFTETRCGVLVSVLFSLIVVFISWSYIIHA